MRAGYAILLFAFFGLLSSARADVITSTSANVSVPGLAACSSSGQTHSICAISGDGGDGAASASADPFEAMVIASASAPPSISGPKVIASAEAQINGEYVLYGGTGTGSFDLNYAPFSDEGGFLSCSVAIDGGNAQSCSSPVIVEYGLPFTMDVDLNASAESAAHGEGVEGQAVVVFSQQGLSATPEPSSILLMMPGLAGVMFAAKSRLRKVE